MSLFDIAIKNIKKNFDNYLLYFISMVFSILMYFTFATLQYTDKVEKAINAKAKLSNAFSFSSVVLILFATIFIWYSNSFFTRKRKREIGLYAMLGVKKKDISKMLFYETLIMGIIASIVGIVLGIFLSNIFIMILLRLMDFTGISIGFVISMKAIVNTFLVFLVIFLIVSLHSRTLIYRFKLIDLFKAESTGEKEPKASVIKAIFSLTILILGYFFSTKVFSDNFALMAGLTLLFTIVGTYLLFSSFVVFIVKMSKKNKKKYYNGINMIGTSQLLYRIKGNARTLATIAILSATTLTTVGIAYSLYYNAENTVRNSQPYSYSFKNDNNLDKTFEEIVKKYPENKVLAKHNVDILAKKITMDGGREGSIESPIISVSEYNSLAKDIDYKSDVKLNKGEAFFNFSYYAQGFSPDYKGKNLKIENKNFKIIDFAKASPMGNSLSMEDLIVLNDEDFKELYSKDDIIKFTFFKVANEKKSEKLTNEYNLKIDEKVKENMKASKETKESDLVKGFRMYSSNFYEGYKGSMVAYGMLIFIGGFLGLVFLLSTGSIIFFKQLSEATNDKGNYAILRKIGVSEKEVKKSINKQILIVFLLPLILGATHAYMAVRLLEPLFSKSLIIPMLITLGAYSVIYLVYYILTTKAYYKIVSEK
ncbi:putative ABC transport system permease protein [Clostridium cavendishii DSM 21758]|uniref:Putative ABC transport system permease protein n=1 Tax=Clostridium cavendishii DSM 21758 TaxID=1121302 RepID=A0A1M6TGS1_9CLOT|nr:ABC transporter permease [Clostridium cavendishii]SHK56099.1 putative ABC transport system permease protein [Clostridium cavendishii DSM 21758]